jgi:MtN3 and saliva related transmembrane protein
MGVVDVIGFTAGALTTVAFVPQVVKTWKTRSARDVSLGMLTLFATGVALWLIYGIIISSTPIIIANGLTLVLAVTNVVLKLKYE